MYLITRSRALVRAAVAITAISGMTLVGAGAARADSTTVATAFTATLSGTQLTATLTAADGTTPAGEPVFASFRVDGDVGATRTNAADTDAHGQVRVSVLSPDVGFTYWSDTPGDALYAASTSNSIHVNASVATRLWVTSTLSGVTVSGTVSSPHNYHQAGTTVQVYAGPTGPSTLAGSSVTNVLGRWSVSLPPISTPTTFQAQSMGNPETDPSTSNRVTVSVPTQTTIHVAVTAGRISVHGAVTDGLGVGQPGESIRILGGPPKSNFRDLGLVTTTAQGQYSFTGPACATACVYEAVALQDATHDTSWAISGTVTAPTHLALSAQPGRPDHITAALTYAATATATVGQGVTLYYHYTGQSTWTEQHRATTDRYGRITFAEQPRRGCYFTARYAGTSAIAAAASANSYLSF